MAEIRINAKPRTAKTKSYLHQIRHEGRIPAVIYGRGHSSQAVELDVREFESAIRKKGRNALMDLTVKGEKGQNKIVVMVKDMQRDALHGDIIHADLFEVSMNQKIHSRVPVVFKGEAKGQKAGGVIQAGVREVEVEGLPGNLPEVISIDVSNLDIGDHLTAHDIPSLEGCRVLTDPEATLVTITAPRRAEEIEKAVEKPAVDHARAAEPTAAPLQE